MNEKNESHRLKGKTVVITAGNRGGGATIAMRYAAAGANLAIIANKEMTINVEANMNEVSECIVATGGNAITLTINLADSQEIKEAVTEIITHFNKNFHTFWMSLNHGKLPDQLINNLCQWKGKLPADWQLFLWCIPGNIDEPEPKASVTKPALEKKLVTESGLKTGWFGRM